MSYQLPQHVLELFPRDTDGLVAELGLPQFVSKQLLDWIYKKQVHSVDEMSNIGKEVRERLSEVLAFRKGKLVKTQNASDGTRKHLLEWETPEKRTETVMIPAKTRRTACVSSQVGCPVGCTFCASGLEGLGGNLSAGQIVEQVVSLGANEITNIVFM